MANGNPWPGVLSDTTKELRQITTVHKVEAQQQEPSKHVTVTVGERPVDMYADTGSGFSIIPPDKYEESMGEVVPVICEHGGARPI